MLAGGSWYGDAGPMTTPENVIEVRELRKTYGHVAAVDGISWWRPAEWWSFSTPCGISFW